MKIVVYAILDCLLIQLVRKWIEIRLSRCLNAIISLGVDFMMSEFLGHF